MLTIKPMYNAWEKASRFLLPNPQSPIRDIWVNAGEKFWYENGSGLHYFEVPDPKAPEDPLYLSYTNLWDLYNNGNCRIGWLTSPSSTVYTLTADQRNAYVWEILGRVCHLLTDMSVPAHVHKDIHAKNQINTEYVLLLGNIFLIIHDADSYEQWIAHAGSGQDGDLTNIYWTADMILENFNPPYIIPPDQQDQQYPLPYLMSEMRSRAAAFASDDYDGTGNDEPNEKTDFPIRHDETLDPTNQTQVGMLTTIRDATVPYCIRAVAGLLYWFAGKITMPQQNLTVFNSGVEPPSDFFYRVDQGDPYTAVTSPAYYSKSVGDKMLLSSHYEKITGQTQISKFFSWSTDRHEPTGQHQRDFIVMENNGDFKASYPAAEFNDFPNIAVWFEGAAVNPTSQIMFKNPWLVDPSQSDEYSVAQLDQFLPYPTSPLAQGIFNVTTTNNGGLFLDAGDPQTLLPPYYAIGVPWICNNVSIPKTTHQRGDWLFTGLWRDAYAQLVDDPLGSDNGLDAALYYSKAVIFNTSNAWVWANYKGHLLTSVPSNGAVSECAICPNSQRKIDWIDNQLGFNNPQQGIDQMVYESMGSVWYTHSEDHGATWRKELGIAEGERPSIVSGWDAPYVVYYRDMWVHFGKVVNDSWLEPIHSFDCSDAAAPVIARDDLYGIVVIAWEAYNETIHYCVRNDNGSIFVIPDLHSTNPAYPAVRPTIAHKYGSNAYHLAWREGPSIFYTRIEVGTGVTWPAEVISNSGQPAQGAPSITVDDNDEAAVAWAATEPGIPKTFINFRQNSPGGWGGFASILLDPADDYWAPSISNVTGTQPAPSLRIAHNIESTSGAHTGVMQFINGNWTVPSLSQYMTDGRHPNLVDAAQSPNQLEVYTLPWYPYMGSLCGLWFTDQHLTKVNKKSALLASSREVILTRDTSRIAYRVGEFIVKTGVIEDTLDWSSGMDSLIVGISKPVERYIETEPVTVPGNSNLKLRTVMDRHGSIASNSPLVYTLEIVDAATDSILTTPHSVAVNAMNNGHHDAMINVALQSFSGREVYFRFRLQGRDTTVDMLSNNYYYYPGKTIPKAEVVADMQTLIADMASLERNYPNPFNPNTEISYSLKEDMNIRLVVCDALGREISVLREGRENAGSHIEIFDCRQCNSGVYIYRLETPYGNLSRKMVLMK